jgi:hypothetical protein
LIIGARGQRTGSASLRVKNSQDLGWFHEGPVVCSYPKTLKVFRRKVANVSLSF